MFHVKFFKLVVKNKQSIGDQHYFTRLARCDDLSDHYHFQFLLAH